MDSIMHATKQNSSHSANGSYSSVTTRSSQARSSQGLQETTQRRLLQEGDNLFHRVICFNRQECACAGLDFDFAFGQGLFADADADGKADELGIFEFHAGSFVAVVEDDIHAARSEVSVYLLGALHDFAVGRDVERGDADGVGGDTDGPDDAIVVVALLDDGLEGTSDADAVTAHDGG